MAMTYPADPARPRGFSRRCGQASSCLWCGRPDPSVVFVPADIIRSFHSASSGSASRCCGSSARSRSAPRSPSASLGVPFVLIGVYLVAGRFVTRWLRKRRTIYGITGYARDCSDRIGVQGDTRPGRLDVRAAPPQRAARDRRVRAVRLLLRHRRADMTGPPMAGTGMPTMSATAAGESPRGRCLRRRRRPGCHARGD